MAGSTGPILAAGGIVIFNNAIVMGQPPIAQTRIVVGTLIAAGGFSFLERATPTVAVALSWLVLTAVLLVRVDPTTPSPVESFQAWLYNKK